MTPKLSIILPTRERADTLYHTLRTLTAQQYEDCEIVVCDNASTDNTRDVVLAFQDSRIRYINTGRRLGMADNWEFALDHARGSSVTYIGDDDGFIPGAIATAMEVLEDSGLSALVWEKVEYCWPDHIDTARRNVLTIRLAGFKIQSVNGASRLRLVMRGREGYTRLPCVYNSIVSRRMFDAVRAASINGKFFNALTPDIYSAITLALPVHRYLLTNYPFSINGASRHSNGTSFMGRSAAQPEGPTARFLSETTMTYDPRVRMCPSIEVCVMGEYLFAREFAPGLNLPEPEWKQYLSALRRAAANSRFPEEIIASARHSAHAAGLPFASPAPRAYAPNGVYGLSIDEQLSFRVPPEMVANVYDASVLAGRMLPRFPDREARRPVRRLFQRMSHMLAIEAKALYKSI